MTSGWGWRRAHGKRRSWILRGLEPLFAAVPWITVGLMLLMLHLLGGALTAAEGVLFDLPEPGGSEGVKTDLVALALAMPRGTLVFFDDARYRLDDGVSAASFGDHLRERAKGARDASLLVLADRNVSTGDLMSLASVARLGGVKRVLFANKRTEARAE